jgi:superfamily II DNA or RNA helicase
MKLQGDEKKPHPMEELQKLREENARLKALLTSHGIAWQKTTELSSAHTHKEPSKVAVAYSIADKIKLFRHLFRGRTDVYPMRWESAKGKSGYTPACGNEWKPGVCHKPKVKCGDCPQRQLLPVTDRVIYDHLSGKHTVGVYPLLKDDRCYFLAVDFDGAGWQDDARAFLQSCRELTIPSTLEISRSGNGAHAWIFFTDPVPAGEARTLGAALISHTCQRSRQLSLSSYDRFFPNQDTLPTGGLGNLIALPLQKAPRDKGRSVFVDDELHRYPDQWEHLASIRKMSHSELEESILRASGGRHPLDVTFSTDNDDRKPWRTMVPPKERIPGPLPESLNLVLANQIFIAKTDLSQPLANRLIRLAAFQNPEFYKAQAMRLPVWNKPRIIGCAENFSQYIGLPRGCLGSVLELLSKNGVRADIQDERLTGKKVSVQFSGTLRKDQKAAVRAMLRHEAGVLCAPTAFGKTVTAAAMIARRKVSTLVLVHRTQLMRQWQERLLSFLDFPKGGLGTIGGGKKKLTGNIDIAVMQSLSRRDDLADLLNGYGQIIIDECHHVSAFSFEAILKQAKARYVVGLTATPVRRDGHQPIIFMQCGPVRHSAARPEASPTQLEVWPQYLTCPETPRGASIQDTFRVLINNEGRNHRIANDVLEAYRAKRKILVLTERTGHLELLRNAIGNRAENCFVLHGRLGKKKRASILETINGLDGSCPRILLATGRLIGEGFDHPPLDTLVLAMPISWKGTLQQYAGRLHREHAGKQDIRIYDYVENDHPQLARMWEKRQRGYRAMGYRLRIENRFL